MPVPTYSTILSWLRGRPTSCKGTGAGGRSVLKYWVARARLSRSFGNRLHARRMSGLFAHRDGILAVFAVRRGVGHDHRAMKRRPVVCGQLIQALDREILQEFVGI